MSNRKILLFFLLTFFSLKSFAAVFVVTSNADSGPGTLRDALTQAAANGSATKDYINFNMTDPSEAGRTITITTQLPYVSSNLVIDGTTQPGPALGISGAKIILQPVAPTVYDTPFNALIVYNANGFELYGLYIRDFDYIRNVQSTPTLTFLDATGAIYIEASQNIQIGAPGKGNVFAKDGHIFETALVSVVDPRQPVAFGAEDLKFYSNICGFEPDGTTFRTTPDNINFGEIGLASDRGDIEIGGDDITERNIFGNGFNYIDQTAFYHTLSPLTVNIKNNYFDYDINGQPTPVRGNSSTPVYTIMLGQAYGGYNPPYTFNIINNKMQYPGQITVYHVQGAVTFKGNNVLRETATAYSPPALPQFTFQSDAPITIGGEQPGDANIIYGTQLSAYSKNSILIQHNSIYCVSTVSPQGVYLPDPQIAGLLPKIAISNVSASSISGTATPLSKVELFEDDDCILCQPLSYFATVLTDANGNWSYTGPINKGIIASATLNGFTSVFTASATLTQSTITESSCGNPGSFTNLAFTNSGGYVVKNAQGQVINNSTLTSLAPGKYTLTAENGTCSTDYPFTILDATPKIDDSKKKIIAPSCGHLGSITGLSLANTDVLALDPDAYKLVWLDAGNNGLSSDLDLLNVGAGSYTLQVTYIKQNCTKTYGPVVLTNATGPAIDQSDMQIKPSTCSDPNGSITNIKVTGTSGTVKYTWMNNLQQTVGNSADLTNQSAGVYQLQVTDDSQCGPIFSTYISIPMINILSLDETKATVKPATCGQANASITGIYVTGATSYKWTNALTGEDYTTTTADLPHVPAGTYLLTITNGVCIKQSGLYTATVIQPVALVTASVQLTGDECASNAGSIKGITAQYGSPPYTFTWADASGKTIAQTADLTGVGAGSYTLTVTDASACPATTNYTLTNHDAIITPPVVNDIQLCGPGAAILQVKDPSPGYSYRLYGTGTMPLDEQANGIFKITADANSVFYVTQFLGECESTRAQAHVNIGIAGIDIANTITPNGDGINDYWTIKNIENFPGALVQIFNRYGQKVYESKGYAVPFDGTYNGNKLAAGVYYYIINLGNKCSLLSGSLTIIR